jgi:hypothetical protein
MQPLGLRAFLEGHLDRAAPAPEKNSSSVASSVGNTLRAITRPRSSRTEATVVA